VCKDSVPRATGEGPAHGTAGAVALHQKRS